MTSYSEADDEITQRIVNNHFDRIKVIIDSIDARIERMIEEVDRMNKTVNEISEETKEKDQEEYWFGQFIFSIN